MIRYVGMDVHKHFLVYHVLDEAGGLVDKGRVEPLSRETLGELARTKLRPTDRVAFEVGTNCWAVAGVLRPHVAQVTISNPLQTKAIAWAKIKTDKVDAGVIANLLRLDYLPSVWEPDERTQDLRAWCSRRSKLVGERIRAQNRIHSVLAGRLIVAPTESLFTAAGLAWLRSLEIDERGRWMIDSDLERLEMVGRQIEAIEERLAVLGYEDERVRLLMTLPGVQVVIASVLVAAIGDAGRFRDGDALASYLGLVPSTRQSGKGCYHGPITKRGRSQARWMLVQAAQHVARHPGPLGHFFRRLKQRKNHNIAIVATARKLATIAWRLLATGEPYRYALPRSTEEKLRKLRVKATGQRRKTGPKKGTPASEPPLGKGTRSMTVRSLAGVYASEGLPPMKPAPAGEARTVDQTGCGKLVARIAGEQVVEKRPRPGRDGTNHPPSDPCDGGVAGG